MARPTKNETPTTDAPTTQSAAPTTQIAAPTTQIAAPTDADLQARYEDLARSLHDTQLKLDDALRRAAKLEEHITLLKAEMDDYRESVKKASLTALKAVDYAISKGRIIFGSQMHKSFDGLKPLV